MKLSDQFQKIQQIHLTLESMITLGITGFLVILPILITIIPTEQPEIETPSNINLAMPKATNSLVYTDTLLPKENASKL